MRRFGFGFPGLGGIGCGMVLIAILAAAGTFFAVKKDVRLPMIPGWFYGGKDRMEIDNDYARERAELQLLIDAAQTDLDLLDIDLQFDIVEAEAELVVVELRNGIEEARLTHAMTILNLNNQIEELGIAHQIRLDDIRQKALIWSIAQPVLWGLLTLGLLMLIRSVSTYFMRRASTIYADRSGLFPVLTVRRFLSVVGYYDPNRAVGAFVGFAKGLPQFALPSGQEEAANQGSAIQMARAAASGESGSQGGGWDWGDMLGRGRIIGPALPEPRQGQDDPSRIDAMLEESGQIDGNVAG